MRLKSYFSGTVEAAMELAHKELGEDALLVNARPSTPETRSLGAYEVVFGVLPKNEAAVAAKLGNASLSKVSVNSNDSLAQDVAGLKREIERMAQSLRVGRVSGPRNISTEGSPDLYNLLIENELDA